MKAAALFLAVLGTASAAAPLQIVSGQAELDRAAAQWRADPGHRVGRIASGSMRPQLEVGDYVLSTEYHGGRLVGEVIRVRINETGETRFHLCVRQQGGWVLTVGIANRDEAGRPLYDAWRPESDVTHVLRRVVRTH